MASLILLRRKLKKEIAKGGYKDYHVMAQLRARIEIEERKRKGSK